MCVGRERGVRGVGGERGCVCVSRSFFCFAGEGNGMNIVNHVYQKKQLAFTLCFFLFDTLLSLFLTHI